MTADELKALRKRYGLTQEHAALLAMVTPRTVQYWESGRYSMPAHRDKLIRAATRRLDLNTTSKE